MSGCCPTCWQAYSERSISERYCIVGGRATNNLIIAGFNDLVNWWRSNVAQNLLFALVNDILSVADGNVELLRQRLKANSVQPSAFEYTAVLFVENVLLDQVLPLFPLQVCHIVRPHFLHLILISPARCLCKSGIFCSQNSRLFFSRADGLLF